jgi:hypothetical protein
MTARAAAAGAEMGEQTLWRIETGQVAVKTINVKALCEMYRATPEMTEALVALARETKARGWWQAYGDALPEWFDLYIGLEAAAAKLSTYESDLVPGLFQTETYARTLITADNPDVSEAEIDRRVGLRMARQAILRRPIDPPALEVALSQAVLSRPVGGAHAMASQLNHLADISGLPNLALRIVPFAAGFNSGILSGAFALLRFPLNGGGTESEPPTVFADMYTGGLYLDKPNEIERYSRAFSEIWKVALDERASADLIEKTAEELRHGDD